MSSCAPTTPRPRLATPCPRIGGKQAAAFVARLDGSTRLLRCRGGRPSARCRGWALGLRNKQPPCAAMAATDGSTPVRSTARPVGAGTFAGASDNVVVKCTPIIETRSAASRATADQCGVAWTNPTESIVVDLAENVSSRKLIAIKALNTATSYSASLRTQRNSTLMNRCHLIGLCG
jgi:hypothetical protein